MTPKEVIAEAKKHAEQHKIKKVLKKRAEGDKPAEHDFVPVKKVHVTTPGFACYLDLTDEEVETLKEHAVDRRLSIHEFELGEEKEAKRNKKIL